MHILNKFKKDFDTGFKNFVKSLDVLPTQTTNDLIFNGLLEDPVYLKWALANKLSFDYFFKLTNKEVLKVFHYVAQADVVFLHALKNHPEENNFIESHLPQFVRRQYLINRETEKITVSMQTEARITILKTLYELMENGALDSADWKLPSSDVLLGMGHSIDERGRYEQYYENGILALTGYLDNKGRRTGIWKSFYPTGSLHSKGFYVAGKKHGEWSFYYLNSFLKSNGRFQSNLKEGNWNTYDLNNKIKMINYINGKVFEKKAR